MIRLQRTAQHLRPRRQRPAGDFLPVYNLVEERAFIPNMRGSRAFAAVVEELWKMPELLHLSGSPEDRTITLRWKARGTWRRVERRLQNIGFPPSLLD